MPRKDEQPHDPLTGQWAKEYVFDLAPVIPNVEGKIIYDGNAA